MTQRHSLIAYLATLVAILTLAILANEQTVVDTATFNTAIAGLVGIAGTFRPRQPAADA